MKGYNLAGNDAVEKIASMEITGNVIPIEWFNHIKRPNGKPYSDAIILLSDIVYWYRPIETRDETTGKLLGYRKKFKADKLQRSYGAFAEQYGYTKRQVTDALTHLKEIGIIDLDFRTIKSDGMKIGNVLFIGINADRLLEISHTLSPLNVIGIPIKGDTNTETTTETTIKILSPKELAIPPAPIPVQKSSKPVPDLRSKHPAIQAVRGLMNIYPAKGAYDEVILILGENPNVELLKKCYAGWCMSGYKPTSLKWLDWYKAGGVPQYSKNGPSRPGAGNPVYQRSDPEKVKACREEILKNRRELEARNAQ
jgi:hypothetical protein